MFIDPSADTHSLEPLLNSYQGNYLLAYRAVREAASAAAEDLPNGIYDGRYVGQATATPRYHPIQITVDGMDMTVTGVVEGGVWKPATGWAGWGLAP